VMNWESEQSFRPAPSSYLAVVICNHQYGGCDGGLRSACAVAAKSARVQVVSCEHAYALVRARGEVGWTVRLVPTDGGRADLRELDGDA
jgi:hypothetical protein